VCSQRSTVPPIQTFHLFNGATKFVALNAITAKAIGELPISYSTESGHHKNLLIHAAKQQLERLLMRYLIANLLDPVARVVAYALPGVSGAAVTTKGGFTVKAWGIWLEVDLEQSKT
jgi:hypothetical protein